MEWVKARREGPVGKILKGGTRTLPKAASGDLWVPRGLIWEKKFSNPERRVRKERGDGDCTELFPRDKKKEVEKGEKSKGSLLKNCDQGK